MSNPKRFSITSPHVTVAVSKEHITTAIPRNSGHCMIADAIAQAVPHAINVSVDIQTIRFSDPAKGLRYIYLTPRSAQRALVQFDQGMKPEPFTFRIRGAQVVAMRKKNPNVPKRATLATDKHTKTGPNASGGTMKPIRVGGDPPPRGALSNINVPGLRREFGMRAMKL